MACGYSAGQAAKVVGLPYRTIDHWAKVGFIEPSIGKAEGVGTARSYSFSDLVALKVAMQLKDAGITLNAMRKVAEYLKRSRLASDVHPLSDTLLICTQDGDVVKKTEKQVVSLLKTPGQLLFMWIIDLAQIVNDLQGDVVTLDKPKRGPASKVA